MTINPELAEDGQRKVLFPLGREAEEEEERDEHFILYRENVWFETTLPAGMGKLSGRGVLYLTQERMVFVVMQKANRRDFRAFEIPWNRFTEPRMVFNWCTPCVRAPSILTGKVSMVKSDELPIPAGVTPIAPFKINFGAKSTKTIMPILMKEQQNARLKARGFNSSLGVSGLQAWQSSRSFSKGLTSSEDPSVLYVGQPWALEGTLESVAFLAETKPSICTCFG